MVSMSYGFDIDLDFGLYMKDSKDTKKSKRRRQRDHEKSSKRKRMASNLGLRDSKPLTNLLSGRDRPICCFFVCRDELCNLFLSEPFPRFRVFNLNTRFNRGCIRYLIRGIDQISVMKLRQIGWRRILGLNPISEVPKG